MDGRGGEGGGTDTRGDREGTMKSTGHEECLLSKQEGIMVEDTRACGLDPVGSGGWLAPSWSG